MVLENVEPNKKIVTKFHSLIDRRKIISALKQSIIIAARGEEISCIGRTRHLQKHEALNNRTETESTAHWCLFCGMYHCNPRITSDEVISFNENDIPDPCYSDYFRQAETCSGKTRFHDRLTAMACAYYIRKQNRVYERLNVYFCSYCGYWHYGRSATRDMLQGITTELTYPVVIPHKTGEPVTGVA